MGTTTVYAVIGATPVWKVKPGDTVKPEDHNISRVAAIKTLVSLAEELVKKMEEVGI